MRKEFELSAPLEGESHSHFARHNILRNIMLCNLAPGDIINEAEIAEILGISRTPVHEAVLSLRDARLIDVIPRRESRVTCINLSYVNEGVFLRCALEAELIRSLAGRMAADHLASLEDNLRRQEEIFEKDPDGFYKLDDAFHRCLYTAAGKSLIYGAVSSICSHLDRVRYFIRIEKDVEIEQASLAEHRQLLSILSAGLDPDTDLSVFFRRHITRFQKKLPEYMEKYPDYFVIGGSGL